MKGLIGILAALLIAPPLATAQSESDVEIWVAGYRLAADGPEKPAGVSWGPGKLTVGKSSIGIFSMRDCGYFTAATAANPFEEHATAGWRVEITPIKIVEHAVTVRLRWMRAIDRSNDLSPSSEDVQVTLRPGESRPLDSVPVAPGAKTFDNRPCDIRAASLRLTVDFPAFDRRLIGANLWLVERLPNGKEQSQLQSLRGLPNRAIPFYFDSVADGTKRIDFFGKLVADPEQGTVEVALETVRGVADPSPQGYQAARWFRSTVQLKPNEIVEVALRQPDDVAAAPGARVFSLRIQAKQIR
jgi:hypothetical protein